jgi:two-component system sensor histidine kinase/response regulator
MNIEPIDLFQKDILIVDDTFTNLRILSQILTDQGYKVRKALDGQMALTACKMTLPDLILLDIMMPEMDGYTVCQYLKANEETRNIPIIFISALDEPFDKVKALQLGAVDYITKPFHLEEVLVRVKNQLTINQLHYQLVEQNVQLQKVNAALKQFTIVASHDLQSPLQTIIINAELVKVKHQDILVPDVIDRIDKIINTGLKMKQLVQDLLTYSRLETSTKKYESINCQILIKEVLANLESEIYASGASISYVELPILIGDYLQLMQLFQNLISNAIKFCRPGVPPIIKISATIQSESIWMIGVHDNGIGIERENFERIFEVFQRLHTSKEYPGNGIGISICKKIVEDHGGQIWVESEMGVGTTFYFTLPSDRCCYEASQDS